METIVRMMLMLNCMSRFQNVALVNNEGPQQILNYSVHYLSSFQYI